MAVLSPFDLIRQDLQAVEQRMRALPFSASDPIPSVLEDLLNSGGKRIRPALTLLFGKMFAVPDAPLHSLAAAIEIVHTATLVHDDLIDNAHLRRGKPTANAKWEPGAAILMGDFLFAWAAQLAAAAGSTPVMQRFAAALTTVVSGEIGQMFGKATAHTFEEYLRRIQEKTATLFEAACESPLLLVTRPAEAKQAAAYGLNFGIAFQMADDILDVTGDSNRMGKPVESDLEQGLITLPTIYYGDLHPEDPDLRALLSGHRASADIDRLLRAIRASDAVDRARARAREFAGKASAALATLPAGAWRDALQEITLFAVERNQ